jgi:hypothetical protein
MHRVIVTVLATAFVALGVRAAAVVDPSRFPLETIRKVYLSASDSQGAPVVDLTAADVKVKEGGKPYPVMSLEPASAPMQVVVIVDSPAPLFQAAIAQFLDKTRGKGQFMIIMLSPRSTKLVDFTADTGALTGAIAKLSTGERLQAVQTHSDHGDLLMEAVTSAAKALQQRKMERSLMVVFTTHGGQLERVDPEPVLSLIRSSGASLNLVHRTSADLGPVLLDGFKQTGGRVEEFVSGPNVNIGPAASRLADGLLRQYVLTYALPDGVKMSDKIAIETSRKDVKLIAPARIPDR